MKAMIWVIFLLCSLSFTEGHKVQNYNKKKLKEIKNQLDDLETKIAKLKADTEKLQTCMGMEISDPNYKEDCIKWAHPEDTRTDVADLAATNLDVFWAANLYMNNGDRCGPQVIDIFSVLES